MSKILSIESSGAKCGVCVAENNVLLSEYTIHQKNNHDRLLAKNVKQVLDDLDLSVKDLDAVAVSSGPGSYTGLRVGASLAKALCFDGTPKLIEVPTMNAFAYDLHKNHNYAGQRAMCIIHSHQDVFYSQEFDLNYIPRSEIKLRSKSELENLKNTDLIFMGIKTNKLDLDFVKGLDDINVKMISNLAFVLYEENKFVDPAEFVPKYSQKFVVK